jgi:cytochrome P450
MEELNALPYLDAVVRETLRIHAPVATTMRVATQDDILPLGEPIKDKYGRMMDGIPRVIIFLFRSDWLILLSCRIKKGQTLMIPILALNRAKSIWGEDSLEFKCVCPIF